MKKIYLGIFIAIVAIIAMSHNANAISPVIDLSNYQLVSSRYATALSCEWVNMRDSISSGNNYCRGTINNTSTVSGLTYIYSTDTYSVKKGDILTFFMLMQTWNNTQVNSTQLLTLSNSQLGWNVLDYVVLDEGDITPEMLAQGYINPAPNNDMAFNADFYSGFYKLYQITLIANMDGNLHFGLNNTTNNRLFSWNVNEDYGKTINFKLSDFKQYRFLGSSEDAAAKKELESTENIEDQTTPSDSQIGDDAAATNLISAFGGFVSALGGLSATNCNLTLDFPDFAGGSRVVNVCQNKDKAGNIISVFSSLTLIVFYVPLAIKLLTMIYNEIRSFTNG